MASFDNLRREMVERQIASRGVRDPRVLDAMREVPRERFMAPRMRVAAYDDCPLPIEEGQTISQPYIVAVMVEALDLGPEDRVLEIGTGSGYAAAILSRLAREVYTVERHPPLVTLAKKRVQAHGYTNIRIRCGDGTLGWADHAPYDAILVSAGGPVVPASLLQQLRIGGRLVMPLGMTQRSQTLQLLKRLPEDEYQCTNLGSVKFVPLIGSEGWDADTASAQLTSSN